MVPFKFEFHGELHDASFRHYLTPDGYDRFQVDISTGESLVLMRLGIDPRIWIQDVQMSTIVEYSHEFALAVGQGVERVIAQKDAQE
jgi:hypothetical protein